MYAPLTSQFLQTVSNSYDSLTVVDLYRSGALLTDPAAPLRVVGGEVTGNAQDPIRRTLSAVLLDKTGALTPQTRTDLLMPNGVEARVRMGPVYADGSMELVPIGRFRLTASTSSDGQVEVRGFDLAYRVQSPMLQPYFIGAGLAVEDAVVTLVLTKDPTIPSTNMQITGDFTQATLVDFNDDPWAVARKMARASGCDLFFDPDGGLVMAAAPTQPGAPVLAFVEGENATFWDPKREIQAEGTPSVIVVEVNHSSLTTALRVSVSNNDPASLTYSQGPYGEIVEVISSDKVRDQAQATRLGRSTLNDRAWIEEFSFDCIPNPAIQEGDSISVTRAPLKMVAATCLVDSFRLPLVPGSQPMSITAKTRREPDMSVLVSD